MLARIASIAIALCLLTVALANADPTSPGAAGQPAPAATLTPAAQTPAPLNIAFDQVDRTLAGTATPPPITGFADEVQAAIDAQHASGGMNVGMGGPNLGQMAVDMIPVVGTIFSMSQAKKQMEQAKKQQQAMMDQLAGAKPPVLTRYAFYNGWTRVETASSIIITKPDQHQVVFIDVQAKTYRTYDTTAPVQTEQSTVAGAPTSNGEATANSMLSIGQADTQTVDSQQVVGYSSEAIVTLTGSSGTCQDGTFRAKKLEYLAQLPEPVAQSKEVALDTLALPNGCSATINRQVSGTPVPSGQMYVYRLVTVVRDAIAAAQKPESSNTIDPAAMMQRFQGGGGPQALPANYLQLSQRGNIRQLTAADVSLFDIPAGYTQDK